MGDIAGMSWVGLALAIVAAYFAIKVVKFVFKLFWWIAVLAGAYWFFGPMLNLPNPLQ